MAARPYNPSADRADRPANQQSRPEDTIESTVNVNYILIDYENVQPADLTLLQGQPVRVKVFLGSHQTEIPVSLASAIQVLESNAESYPAGVHGP